MTDKDSFSDCDNRLLIPLSDLVIYDHLAGKRTVGVYLLLTDDTCHLLAAQRPSESKLTHVVNVHNASDTGQ